MGTESMAEMRMDSYAIQEWKKEMTRSIREAYGQKLSQDKIDAYLNRRITETGRNPKIVLVNNYLNREVKTDLLELINYIEGQQLIVGGEGCLFMQHSEDPDEEHVVSRFITFNKKKRNEFKAARKKYQKGTLDWIMCDLGQNNKKLKNNGLYGCLGCATFVLFNKFIAESVTNGGRQIICTATMTFENFLGVDVRYNYENEVFTFIHRVRDEIKSKYPNGLDCSTFYFENLRSKTKEKLIGRCAFPVTTEFAWSVEAILDNCNLDELVILYYKNNFLEFSKTPVIKTKLKYIMSHIDKLRSPDIKYNDPEINQISPEIVAEIDALCEFYETFVMYTDPMFDRVRKSMFSDRDKVLYTDTDSTFLALNEWVTYIKEEVLQNHYSIEELEMNFVAVNVLTYILNTVIAKGLMALCRGMNITEKWGLILTMKNEFYLAMIVFTNAKKRYISDAVLQEGVLLIDKKTGEIGYPEIKGFDFKKAVVKPFVTNYFTNLSIYDILRADNIRVDKVYMKLMDLKKNIEESIMSGSHEYYKQAKVQLIEQYKKPYQVQGIRAVLLWNCIFEDMQMELPVDCDIVPIRNISDRKGRIWLMDNFPDIYKKVERDFFNSPNELIRNMELKVIGLPKNNTELPEWFFELVDKEKIVSDILSLYYPIMESLGMNISKMGKKTHLTNMVDL